ncbi:hypothetical protein IPC624_14860 [Pseudomonas aeruginosa]|nr:hypothetical protein IPC624_14860 [Pseudomonas aeruginosa]
MRPEPTNAPAALSRRFSVAPMMDWLEEALFMRASWHCVFTLCSLSDTPLLHRSTTWLLTGLTESKKDWTH